MATGLFTDFDTIEESALTLLEPLEGEVLPTVIPDSISFGDSKLPTWPANLTFELALGINSLDTILNKYELSHDEYEYLSQIPAFRKELIAHTTNIQKHGLTFRIKAAAQAESYLEEIDEIVRNHQNPVSTRLDAIKSTVEWGDLKPKESKDNNQTNQQFNISICF